MGKAYNGFNELKKLKLIEMGRFYKIHKEIISQWQKLESEYLAINNQQTNALLNEADGLIKSKNK